MKFNEKKENKKEEMPNKFLKNKHNIKYLLILLLPFKLTSNEFINQKEKIIKKQFFSLNKT